MMTPQQILLQGQNLWIINGRWEEVRAKVKELAEWKVKRLFLYNNFIVTMGEEIAHIRLAALTVLDLGSNDIQSIKVLPNICMPHLQELYLSNNKIISVRAIRKSVWPLNVLELYNNQFGDAKYLAEGFFPSIQLLEVYDPSGDINRFTESCFLAKMQTSSLSQLSINENRFCFPRYQKVFEQKWPEV